MPTNPAPEITLPDLWREINEREAIILSKRERVEDETNQAIQLAIEQGRALLRVREKYIQADWYKELEAHFPQSIRTAQAYMALATKDNERRLENPAYLIDPKMIQLALKALDLVPEMPKAITANQSNPPENKKTIDVDFESVCPQCGDKHFCGGGQS